MSNEQQHEPKRRGSRFLLEVDGFPTLSRGVRLGLSMAGLFALIHYLQLTPEQAIAVLTAYGLGAASAVKVPQGDNDGE